jgi:hypothetical protein
MTGPVGFGFRLGCSPSFKSFWVVGIARFSTLRTHFANKKQ